MTITTLLKMLSSQHHVPQHFQKVTFLRDNISPAEQS